MKWTRETVAKLALLALSIWMPFTAGTSRVGVWFWGVGAGVWMMSLARRFDERHDAP